MRIRTSAATSACCMFLGAGALGQTWMRDFTAADAAAQDRYGDSIAVSVDRIVVGARLADSATGVIDAGKVYVYRQVGALWVEEARFEASDPAAFGGFGTAIAIDGDSIVVGAPRALTNGVPKGAAYVFEFVSGSWTQTARLSAADLLWGDEFGASVAIDGNSVVVGAPKKWAGLTIQGAAYVFQSSVGWWEMAKLEASDAEFLDDFGAAVAIDEGRIAVGAPAEDDPIKQSGAIYIFEGFTSSWTETTRLKPADSKIHDGFGSSLSLHQDLLVGGAPGGDWAGQASGSAFVYEMSGGAWQERGRLVPNNLGAGDNFGTSVTLRDDELFVGAPGYDGFEPNGGAVWMYGQSGFNWLQLLTLSARQPTPHFAFGSSVSFIGMRLAVGTPHESSVFASAGSADLWSLSGAPAHSLFCFGQACPCGNDDALGGCFNSTGIGARLEASGSLSLSRDDLVVTTHDLAPSQFAMLFMGPAQTSSLFGDGLRCADAGNPLGPGYHLFGPPKLIEASGVLTVGPGRFQSVVTLSPGQTRFMQVWYRDAQGPCSSSFNVSNALAVSFTP